MQDAPFTLFEPVQRSSYVVFAAPHSGRRYAPEFLAQSVLDSRAIRASEDAFVDQLFAPAVQFGAPLLVANAPRAYVDLNRGCDELDPAVIEGVKSLGVNARIASGLGVVPRVVAIGTPIYRGKISLKEAQERIDRIWWPYHHKLTALLDQTRVQFGQAILIDCHSMPHSAVSRGPLEGTAPQIVLGDRFGAAADETLMAHIHGAFVEAGFRVARNTPFAGAFISRRYGKPQMGQHAVQIEIDRSLYMDEARIRPSAEFDAVRRRLVGVIADIARLGQSGQELAAQ